MDDGSGCFVLARVSSDLLPSEKLKSLSRVITSRMSHLIDYSKRKSAHHVILRDMVMLENQIPMFIVRKVLEFQHLSVESADEMMLSMILGLAKEVSPFKTIELPSSMKILEHSHLLDFLYAIIVPKVEEPIEIEFEQVSDRQGSDRGFGFDSSYVKQLLKEIWQNVFTANDRPSSSPQEHRIICDNPAEIFLDNPI
ncbi:hypothetical protein OIU76_018621 [Salix suchowensis]|nr:hypothetical protein OIU76_018621 [Salix suchowensis]